jgi:membrane fusion protein (multidrug efflux system)
MSAYEQDGAAALEAEITGGAGASAPAGGRRRLRRWRVPLMVGVPVLALVLIGVMYLSGGRMASTDDAYVQAARVNVSTNVPGRVVELAVHENQFVHAGDLLFRLDPASFDTAVEEAEAALARARQEVLSTQASYGQQQASVGAAQAGVGAAAAQVRTAQANLAYAQTEFARTRRMTTSGVTSQQQLDTAQHNVQVAREQLAQAQQQLASARQQVTAAQQQVAGVLATLGGRAAGGVDENPAVQQAKAGLDRARLNRSYTVVRAPQDGTVTRVEQLQVGSYVTAAQPLFFLVAPRMWVDANFKEDQLTYMRPGQRATIRIDAYPETTFHAHVASLSPGTGSAFAVLPAENATGNWVKVAQRLPVRLAFDGSDAELRRLPLGAGLSAKVAVDTGHRRSLFGFGGGHAPAAVRTATAGAPR